MAGPVLELNDVTKSFGGVHAIKGLSFSVNQNEIVGLIGPNGSGKTTTVNVLSGALPMTSGDILLNGESLVSFSESVRVKKGLTRTFQTASFFSGFTVFEQVFLACDAQLTSNPLMSILRTKKSRQETIDQNKKVHKILQMTKLVDVIDVLVESISSAQQRLLMIATAMASEPKILLLDEPAAGMVKHEREDLAEIIANIRRRGIPIVVIEHHMSLIMKICDRIVVLNFGEKIAEGDPVSIRNNPAVIDAYLGGGN
jgi:branched-chain amino acid transport system ATP-binding protein